MARFYHLKHSAERLKTIRDEEKMKSAGAHCCDYVEGRQAPRNRTTPRNSVSVARSTIAVGSEDVVVWRI
jgi:hypothetical protein